MKRRAKPRAEGDRVDPRLHREVLERDRMCFVSRIRAIILVDGWDEELPPTHVCRDAFNNEHSPADLNRLTVDHFWRDDDAKRSTGGTGTYGDRAPSDEAHLVAACHWLNQHGITKLIRRLERRYSTMLYPKGGSNEGEGPAPRVRRGT